MKATREEVDERTQMLVRHMLMGEGDSIQWFQDETGLSQASAYNYVNKARVMLADTIDQKAEWGRGIEMLHACQQAQMRNEEYADAVRAQGEINKMLGLNAPDRLLINAQHTHSAPAVDAIAASLDKIAARGGDTDAALQEALMIQMEVEMEGEDDEQE